MFHTFCGWLIFLDPTWCGILFTVFIICSLLLFYLVIFDYLRPSLSYLEISPKTLVLKVGSFLKLKKPCLPILNWNTDAACITSLKLSLGLGTRWPRVEVTFCLFQFWDSTACKSRFEQALWLAELRLEWVLSFLLLAQISWEAYMPNYLLKTIYKTGSGIF